MVGAGVLVAVIGVGALFVLTGTGFRAARSGDSKAGALRNSAGGSGSSSGGDDSSGKGVHISGATRSVQARHIQTVAVTRRRAAAKAGADSYSLNTTNENVTGRPDEEERSDNTTQLASGTQKGSASSDGSPAARNGTSTRTSTVQPSTTPEKKLMARTPLVCVFGNRTDWKMHFPEDGLCDLVFYDSLYGHEANTFRSGNFTADLRRVLAAFKAYNVTQRGLAVTSTSVNKARSDLSSAKGKATFERLWASGIYHYGVLDIAPTNKTRENDIQVACRLLNEIRNLSASYVAKNTSLNQYLAVGITYLKTVNQKIYRVFENATNEHQIPLVILRTHLGPRDEAGRGECRISGSTVWGKPVANSHPNIGNTLDYVRQRRSSFGHYTRLLMSVSLAGRWYSSLTGGSNRSAYAIGAKCKPLDFGAGMQEMDSRVTACTEHHYVANAVRNQQHEVMETYDDSAALAFVFDSEGTLFAKVCKAWNTVKKGAQHIGLTVFDVEFDDWSNTCSSWNKFGNYTLVRTARKAVDVIAARNSTRALDCSALPK
ncbi:uncharacterized protein LOC144129926 [Amblyomma americanum]